ncbi:MAG: nucleotidyltransferase [Syntrophus sp. (in: bacteria)]|nr:nucleotidyltransferase [Syntrophus sp. (in: bacteria)]
MYPFEKYKDEIETICRTYRVKSLVAFGSAISDEFDEFDDNSDIDFLLELTDAENGLSRYMNIKFELETLFNRSVDIVMPKAIKNRLIKTYIFSNIRKIYAA